MGCGCPTSFNDKNLKKASNPTAETHRESGFAADSMMDETPKKLNQAKIRLHKGLRKLKLKRRPAMRGRSQSVDDEVSFQHGDSDVNNVNTTQGITDDEQKKKLPQIIKTDSEYNIVIHPARSNDDMEYIKKYGTWDLDILESPHT